MNVLVIGVLVCFLVSVLIIGLYRAFVKEERLSLAENIAKLDNGAIKDKLLKQKAIFDKKDEISTTIFGVLVVISMVCGVVI